MKCICASPSLYVIFPARVPEANTTALTELQQSVPDLERGGDGRSAGLQAGYQFIALVVTFAIAIVSGSLTGSVILYHCMQ